ncbi:hypothetical protein U370_01540 [Anaplasma marginale str. Dawn]|uniref:Uncharacterized protein n=2 Tax=Anaplasma marginale TaxID=770 RepID=B9KI61_ANAMF|nr:hypothetical protein [Anaplasma marginale]ACM49173.1 Hypothetical protein AMF_302 [Anaplasma marginale str. Florida]AGZ78726.1 hypothetical protein U128_01575 [Anaplasma marginale str. Gypsy Plains]AGZ79569.1 hypothetical protein U370_01540 [Anaplasma marginale str. Dawn]AAV86469.1 hypothetical protein AM413 [Anaplasma marginale str. St. Maries]AXW83924.1 hypothetical protein CQZ76_01570 [Anaplasma marginale]
MGSTAPEVVQVEDCAEVIHAAKQGFKELLLRYAEQMTLPREDFLPFLHMNFCRGYVEVCCARHLVRFNHVRHDALKCRNSFRTGSVSESGDPQQ